MIGCRTTFEKLGQAEKRDKEEEAKSLLFVGKWQKGCEEKTENSGVVETAHSGKKDGRQTHKYRNSSLFLSRFTHLLVYFACFCCGLTTVVFRFPATLTLLKWRKTQKEAKENEKKENGSCVSCLIGCGSVQWSQTKISHFLDTESWRCFFFTSDEIFTCYSIDHNHD